MDKSKVGRTAEGLVADFFERNGITVIERNYRVKDAELDLIIKDGDYIAFVEVKYRGSKEYGLPSEAVNFLKQKKICKAAKVYLYQNHYPQTTYTRFDIVSVIDGKIEWIRNAFEYV